MHFLSLKLNITMAWFLKYEKKNKSRNLNIGCVPRFQGY